LAGNVLEVAGLQDVDQLCRDLVGLGGGLPVLAGEGAEAVQPGYGFLAENAGFAQIVDCLGRRLLPTTPSPDDH